MSEFIQLVVVVHIGYLQFSYTNTSMGYRNSTYGGIFDNPVIGAQANVTASTGILSYLSRLHVKAPDGNNSNAHERRSVVTISNNTNGSFSVSATSSNSGNYSLPTAGTGWDGYCYTSGMDGAKTTLQMAVLLAGGLFYYVPSSPQLMDFHGLVF